VIGSRTNMYAKFLHSPVLQSSVDVLVFHGMTVLCSIWSKLYADMYVFSDFLLSKFKYWQRVAI
jgi:hypothetical protein